MKAKIVSFALIGITVLIICLLGRHIQVEDPELKSLPPGYALVCASNFYGIKAPYGITYGNTKWTSKAEAFKFAWWDMRDEAKPKKIQPHIDWHECEP